MEQRYEQLETEKRNERTEHIDECTTLEILELILSLIHISEPTRP